MRLIDFSSNESTSGSSRLRLLLHIVPITPHCRQFYTFLQKLLSGPSITGRANPCGLIPAGVPGANHDFGRRPRLRGLRLAFALLGATDSTIAIMPARIGSASVGQVAISARKSDEYCISTTRSASLAVFAEDCEAWFPIANPPSSVRLRPAPLFFFPREECCFFWPRRSSPKLGVYCGSATALYGPARCSTNRVGKTVDPRSAPH